MESRGGESSDTKDRPSSFLDADWSWSNPSTYPLSIRFLPVGVALVAIYIAIFFGNLLPKDVMADKSCIRTFNYTFPITKVKQQAEKLATHDWEIGTAAEALLELLSPDKSVFGTDPFPAGNIPGSGISLTMDDALEYVMNKVQLWNGPTIMQNNYSAADPASLGVSAIIIGQRKSEWMDAATREKDYLLHTAPRYENGAISHRVEVAELWSDGLFMFPPFLAYYGVATKDLELLKEAVRQIDLYRDVLMVKEGRGKGLWRHIVGPSDKRDEGLWSTGNGWVAYGIARVRATIAGWEGSKEVMKREVESLDGYLLELIEGTIATDDDASGLLRNYLGDGAYFAEAAGTALLATAAYRLGIFLPQGSADQSRMLWWADEKRKAVIRHIDEDGGAKPVVHSLKHDQREPFEGINPEAESFLLLMAAAWRDCVCSGIMTADIST